MTAMPDATTEEFRAAFPTWAQLREHVADVARFPEFNQDRALRQILMADLLTRLSAGHDEWLLLGSLGLPSRVPTDTPPPADLAIDSITGIDQAYVLPRIAFDLDLYAAGIADQLTDARAAATGPEYGARVRAAIDAATAPADTPADAAGRGLGGLVAYTPGHLRQYDNGQVMGTIIAHPIDPRYSTHSLRPVDDPITIEIDIKPPSKIVFRGEAEPSTRPIAALSLPGFHPTQPRQYPVAEQLADKLCLLTGPPVSLRDAPSTPWHRYKDLIDSYFLIRTVPMAADAVRHAVDTNWNLRRLGLSAIPQPYRLYGQPPTPPGEPTVPWEQGCASIAANNPQLRRYPDFPDMIAAVQRFVDTIPATSATWTPGRGWQTTRAASAAPQAFPSLHPARTPTQRPSPQPPEHHSPTHGHRKNPGR